MVAKKTALVSATLLTILVVFVGAANMGTAKVESCSMYPSLSHGDTVVYVDVGLWMIWEGDIVVYEEPGLDVNVTHRVVRIAENRLETKGDNNPAQLEFETNVTPDQIKGKKIIVVRSSPGEKQKSCEER